MQDKRTIIQSLFPQAVLKALTPEALHALPATMQRHGLVVIHEFPFNIGRESRVMVIKDNLHRIERLGSGVAKGINDVYLLDSGALLQISREHCRIEQNADGSHQVVDRGSKCGVIVNDTPIGEHTGEMSAPLKDGDLLTFGTSQSPYRFMFITGFDSYRC